MLSVNKNEWLEECKQYEEFINSLGADAPAAIVAQLKALKERLQK